MRTQPVLPLQQHPQFAAALTMLGRDIRQITLPGAAPVQVIRRFGLRFAPRGPIWDDGTEPAQRFEALRKARLHILNTDAPSDVMRPAGYRMLMTPAHVAELDLTPPLAEMQSRMSQKWRNSWRKARKSPLKIKSTPFAADLHDWLLQADLEQQKAKKYRALPHSVLGAYAALYPSDTLVFEARIKRDVVAAMVFLSHGGCATYHLGWSNDIGRRHAAHQALLMHAAQHFADKNLRRLDLGTLDTDAAPGLARFKIGSGAKVRSLGGTWLRLPL